MREEFKYTCPWCGFEFEQEVGIFDGVTSQVKCPTCGNFIKTFEGK